MLQSHIIDIDGALSAPPCDWTGGTASSPPTYGWTIWMDRSGRRFRTSNAWRASST